MRGSEQTNATTSSLLTTPKSTVKIIQWSVEVENASGHQNTRYTRKKKVQETKPNSPTDESLIDKTIKPLIEQKLFDLLLKELSFRAMKKSKVQEKIKENPDNKDNIVKEAISNFLSAEDYRMFFWAVDKGRIDALTFLVNNVAPSKVIKMAYYEHYRVFSRLVKELTRLESFHSVHNKENSVTGFKIFIKIYGDTLSSVLGDSERLYVNLLQENAVIKQDLIDAIEELRKAGEVDIDDTCLKEIMAKVDYTVDTTDEDTDSDTNTSTESTSSEDSNISSNSQQETSEATSTGNTNQLNTQTLAQDTDTNSKIDLSTNQPAQNSNASESTNNHPVTLLLEHYLSWIKELPEWLQEHYMNSHAIQNLIKYIESSTAKPETLVNMFEHPKESRDSSSNNIASYQEELAQAKVEQADIEMPEDITMANWLMSSVPTLHLPTEIATCILGSFIPSSNDIKDSGNIMPAACIAKFGYDAISSYFLNNYETNDNLIARAIDQISLEA